MKMPKSLAGTDTVEIKSSKNATIVHKNRLLPLV